MGHENGVKVKLFGSITLARKHIWPKTYFC